MSKTKKDIKSMSPLFSLVGAIGLAISGAFLAFDHKVISLVFTILSILVLVVAIGLLLYKPKRGEPRIRTFE